MSIGPTSLMAIMVNYYTHEFGIDYVVLLCFLSGCVEFVMGLLSLGKRKEKKTTLFLIANAFRFFGRFHIGSGDIGIYLRHFRYHHT